MNPQTLAFDVYGTLVNPLEMAAVLKKLVGVQSDGFAALWREKQIEYSFRRGLMRRYENFNTCTRQALQYAMLAFDVHLSQEDQERLLDAYQHLGAFPDVLPALQALKEQGHSLVAFSNGVEATVRELLDNAGVLRLMDDVVSVDDVGTFKPDPAVYHYLAKRVGRSLEDTWLVSSNAWDVIGARSAGLRAIWMQRNPRAVYDPWGIEPSAIITDLHELTAQLADE